MSSLLLASSRTLDLTILGVYLAVVVGFGCWFIRRSRSAEAFMSAGRTLPGWAVGLSIFGSYVSSISFLANPGKAFDGDWNAWVFALSLPLAAVVATRWFVPFFRSTGEVSAYHHLEMRFGPWARTYGVVCYMLTQLARLGTILYLLALALEPLVGLDVPTLIILSGVVVTVYPLIGGTEGVIWTGVVQAVFLVLGALVCLLLLIVGTPGGAVEIVDVAARQNKFSLGGFGPSLAAPTFWVTLVYGLAINLQNFGIDQSYVQRYITARSDGDARRSVWMGALFYIPLSAVFLLIGTSLYVFYARQPGLLPAGLKADAVLPHFIGTQLPPGLVGLVLAAICSAAMDSNLNCCATLYLCDIHRRYFRPAAGDAESLWILRLATLVMGALSTIAALAMIQVKTALDAWWNLAGLFSGGILGLFLLGLLTRRVSSRAALVATACGVLVILWMSFSQRWTGTWSAWKSPFDGLLVIVFGTLTILTIGLLVGAMARTRPCPERGNESSASCS